MESINYIQAVFADLEAEAPKVSNGNKAACRRSRKHAMNMIKQLKEYRKLLLEKSKEGKPVKP